MLSSFFQCQPRNSPRRLQMPGEHTSGCLSLTSVCTTEKSIWTIIYSHTAALDVWQWNSESPTMPSRSAKQHEKLEWSAPPPSNIPHLSRKDRQSLLLHSLHKYGVLSLVHVKGLSFNAHICLPPDSDVVSPKRIL